MVLEIERALKELNRELKNLDTNISLIVCGGANIILGHYDSRATKDVDFLSPELSEELIICRRNVALKFGYEENWLNNNSKVFINEIPHGWPSRVEELLCFSHLTVFGLCKQDLLSCKLKAHLDRGFDAEDIIMIKPSMQEMQKAEEFVKGYNLDKIQLYDLKNLKKEVFGDDYDN